MTLAPDEALHRARFQRPGVRLIVGPTEAVEVPVEAPAMQPLRPTDAIAALITLNWQHEKNSPPGCPFRLRTRPGNAGRRHA